MKTFIILLGIAFITLTSCKNEPTNYLTNNIFTISDSALTIDTIEFLNDSLILQYNAKQGRSNQIYFWNVNEYLDHDYLVIDNSDIPPFILQRTISGDFTLKLESGETNKYYLKKIDKKSKFKKQDLFGFWVGHSTLPNSDLEFLFDNDSVVMNDFTGGERIKTNYSLNLSGEKIFFYNSEINDFMFYKINILNKDSISLSRISQLKDTFTLLKKN